MALCSAPTPGTFADLENAVIYMQAGLAEWLSRDTTSKISSRAEAQASLLLAQLVCGAGWAVPGVSAGHSSPWAAVLHRLPSTGTLFCFAQGL